MDHAIEYDETLGGSRGEVTYWDRLEPRGGIVQLKEQAVRGYSTNRDGGEKRRPSKQGLAVEHKNEARRTRKTWLARQV